jgi:hypothetical protein
MEAYDQHHDFGAEIGRKEDSALIGGLMFASIAGVALALQFGVPARPNENIPWVREIRYRRHGHAPPCDHGYDHDERDGKMLPERHRTAAVSIGRLLSPGAGRGRRPIPCCHGADVDIRDGLCYKTGTVPRQYQQGRPGYHDRRNGYYEMR